MSLIRLTIDRISYSQNTNGAYALLLNEKGGKRKLPIVIGGFEAQSIAVALEKEIKPPRPLTHDLFKNFSDCFEINLKQVIIHKIVDGVFFSSLICVRDKIEEIIDSRTSDAIALAIRFNSPIFTYESVLETAGIVLKPNTKKSVVKSSKAENFEFNKMSKNQIKKAIEIAVKNEDYELAAKLRDELNKKNE
jgi:bifunctional DNase/RNase